MAWDTCWSSAAIIKPASRTSNEPVAIRPDKTDAREKTSQLAAPRRPTARGNRTVSRASWKSTPAGLHRKDGLARALVEAGRNAEALDHHRQAVRLDPGAATMHMNFGNTLARMRRFEEALAEYDQALAIEPQSSEAHLNKGAALMELGRLDEAVHHYRRAAQLDPNSRRAQHRLAATLVRGGRVDEAASGVHAIGGHGTPRMPERVATSAYSSPGKGDWRTLSGLTKRRCASTRSTPAPAKSWPRCAHDAQRRSRPPSRMDASRGIR